jgi:hypothetical protein
MAKAAAVIGAIFLAALATTAQAADKLCAQLDSFVWAPFEKETSGKPKLRWIEYHWTGEWLISWGYECRHSDITAAQEFCRWLPENVSQEFPEFLPLRIMECEGSHFPRPFPQIGEWLFDINLAGRGIPKNVETVELQVDMRDRKPLDQAIRLVVVPVGYTGSAHDLPPLEDDAKYPLNKR